jgi:hypothetical protein
MPDFKNTTTVPDQDPAQIFANDKLIKLIILGEAQDFVIIADKVADDAPFCPRAVVWFKKGLPANYDTAYGIQPVESAASLLAFSLSATNQVAGILYKTDNADYLTADQLFNQANAIN